MPTAAALHVHSSDGTCSSHLVQVKALLAPTVEANAWRLAGIIVEISVNIPCS